MGKGDLLKTDPRFADIRNRTAHIDELYQLVSEELEQRTTREWLGLLPENEIPIFPMHTLESLLEDEHLAATGFFTEVDHPIVGRIRETAVPSEWSGTVPLNRHPAAALGEHTVDVLREAGLGEQRIHQLSGRQRGIPAAGRAPAAASRLSSFLASPSIRIRGTV